MSDRSLARCIVAAMLVSMVCATAVAADPTYAIEYRVAFVPERGVARVEIEYTPGEGSVREFDFRLAPERYRGVSGDGALEVVDGRAVWNPPESGGTLRYEYRIDRRRRDGGYDARISPDWVIARGDHLVPPAVVTATRGAASRATLRVRLPEDWDGVETGWPRIGDGTVFDVENPERRFSRPTGWIIAGDIGVRREHHADLEVVVAAPRGDAMRRNEILGITNLVLPLAREAFGPPPAKLLIVGAGDPMWRGGLSAPNSLYIHSQRPLISENATSPLVHELVHMLTRIQGSHEQWIAEGTAEYYSLELLRRAGVLSEARFERAMDWMGRRGAGVRTLRDVRSHGPVTARAVVLFAELDAEIASASDGMHNLDDLMRLLIEVRTPTLEDLRDAAQSLIGMPSRTLATRLLD